MILEIALPDLLAGGGVERVRVRASVAEVRDVFPRAAGARSNHHARADAALGLERPDDAAALRVERVHRAALAAHEQAAASDRRESAGRVCIREAEGPFERQLRHLIGGEAGRRRRLETLIGDVDAPPVPLRALGRIERRCRGAGAGRRRARGGGRRRARRRRRRGAEILGHCALFRLGHVGSLLTHDAVGERVDDRLRGLLLQRGECGCTGIGAGMARRAAVFIDGRTSGCLRKAEGESNGYEHRVVIAVSCVSRLIRAARSCRSSRASSLPMSARPTAPSRSGPG